MDLREKILQAKDLKNKKIKISEWGVDVYLKAFSGADRIAFQDKIGPLLESKKSSDYMAAMIHLLLITVVDEVGKPVFTETDFDSLQGKSNAILERLAQEAMAINGLSKEADDQAAKN